MAVKKIFTNKIFPGMEIHYQDSHFHHDENYKVVSFNHSGKTKIFDKIFP